MSAAGSSPPPCARLDVGQRVFVVRDSHGAPIGRWGNVTRRRWAKDGAWVRLDERHERCAFPDDDPDRRTWVLTEPEYCSSVEPGASSGGQP